MTQSASHGGESTTSGLAGLGNVRWGTHLCHFYRTDVELREALVPFFRAGLINRELCVWVTPDPAAARRALALVVPDLQARERAGQLELIDQTRHYGGADFDGDAVLQAWLDKAERATEAGFTGLRLTGDTFWVSQGDRATFARYEEAVHAAFRGRRILALCSYPLQRSSADQLLDVLRQHEFALLRSGEEWVALRSATQLLSALESSALQPVDDHDVRFYDGEADFPAAAIAEFLAQAAAAGGVAVNIATPAHDAAIRAALRARGIEPDEGLLQSYDAEQQLPALFDGTRLDVEATRHFLRATVTASGDQPTFLHGELVNLLQARGAPDAAATLERLWNETLMPERGRVEVLCTYDLSALSRDRSAGEYLTICRAHAQVAGTDAPATLIASALTAELARRRELEGEHARLLASELEARERAEVASDCLARLHTISVALAEAVSFERLAIAVEEVICPSLRAIRAFVLRVTEDGTCLDAPVVVGMSPATLLEYVGSGLAAPLPAVVAYRAGNAIWLAHRREILAAYPHLPTPANAIACLPLIAAGRKLGVLTLGFAEAQSFDSRQRALLEDVARAVALALERAHLYEQAERERQRAEAASRAKDEFLAMLGHELRNPLAPIATALQIMKLRAPSEFAKERGVMERQVAHLSRLLDDLLDVSRIARGKVELECAPVRLDRVLEDAIESVSPLLDQLGHHLDLTPSEEPPQVWGDAGRLRQIFVNLLTNAAKHSPRGGRIEVSVRCAQGWHEIAVKDAGIGIEPHILPTLFDPFVQGRQSLERSGGGLGLGLAIVRALVDLHGGTVEAHSDGPERGSVFSVRLPPLPEGVVAAPVEDHTLRIRRGGSRRVLIVDDNRDAADTLGELLQAAGYQVRVAYDAPSSLARLDQFRPDIALLDIGLPVMDGYDLARELQRRLGRACPKLVAVTGYGQPSDRERSAAAGFAAHVVKPVDMPRLRLLVDELLRDTDDSEPDLAAARVD